MSIDGNKRVHCLRSLPDPPVETDSEVRELVRPALVEPRRRLGPGETAGALTESMVRLVRARTGRGPTKAKATIASDLALVTLGDGLTAAEATLADEGHGSLVAEFRAALLEGLRSDAVASVEEITGRRVVAFLTAHTLDPEFAVLAFHFDPGGP